MRKYYNLNQNIKAKKVRVITDSGENLGVIDLDEALFRTRKMNLDLVEITSKVDPPVCKIIDFRKFRYLEQKKVQSGKKKTKIQDIKEVRFTPFIGKADFEGRINKIKSFLEEGDKVKLTVKFTGRQITRKDFGNRVIDSAMKELEGLYSIEQHPKLQGKMLFMVIKPVK